MIFNNSGPIASRVFAVLFDYMSYLVTLSHVKSRMSWALESGF